MPTVYRDEKDFRRSLITFAAVSDALTSNNDFFLGIAPIFAVIAQTRAGEIFSVEQFSSDVRTQFGLSVPPDVAVYIAPRLHNVGLLERRGSDEPIFFWKAAEVTNAKNPVIDRQIGEIISLFRNFSQRVTPLFSDSYSDQRLEEILFDFLVSTEQRVSAATAILYNDEGQEVQRAKSDEEFVCARFLEDLEDKSPRLFALLGDIANAAILSEVVLELGDGRPSRDRKVELIVYLDAPVAMDLLGLSGTKSKEYSAAIVASLVKIGAVPAMFDHSVEEVRDNLHGLLQQEPRDRKGVTADAIRSGEVDIAFVALVKNNVEEYIQRCGIQILNRPETTLSVQQRSRITRDDEQYLFSKLNSQYPRQKALDRDILSIKMVVCKRDGHVSTDVFRAKHLLLTRNNLLPTVSARMVEENKQAPRNRVPPVETVSRISAALWLELGPTEKLDISRKQLVAACSRVASVRPEILEKMYSVLQRIVPQKAEQFKVMISNPHHIKTVMNFTAGTEDYITDKTAQEAFDRLSSEMVSEEKKKARQREKRQAEQHRLQIEDMATQIADTEKIAEAAGNEVKTELEHRWRVSGVLLNRVLVYYEFLGWILSISWVLAVVFLGASSFGPSSWVENVGTAGFVLAVVVGLLAALGSHFFAIRKWARKQGEYAVLRKARKMRLLREGEEIIFYNDGWRLRAKVRGRSVEKNIVLPSRTNDSLFL